MSNPIFWEKVQGQKHPGRWEIVEHQISSIKVLFKTNAKTTPGVHCKFIHQSQDCFAHAFISSFNMSVTSRDTRLNVFDDQSIVTSILNHVHTSFIHQGGWLVVKYCKVSNLDDWGVDFLIVWLWLLSIARQSLNRYEIHDIWYYTLGMRETLREDVLPLCK